MKNIPPFLIFVLAPMFSYSDKSSNVRGEDRLFDITKLGTEDVSQVSFHIFRVFLNIFKVYFIYLGFHSIYSVSFHIYSGWELIQYIQGLFHIFRVCSIQSLFHIFRVSN